MPTKPWSHPNSHLFPILQRYSAAKSLNLVVSKKTNGSDLLIINSEPEMKQSGDWSTNIEIFKKFQRELKLMKVVANDEETFQHKVLDNEDFKSTFFSAMLWLTENNRNGTRQLKYTKKGILGNFNCAVLTTMYKDINKRHQTLFGGKLTEPYETLISYWNRFLEKERSLVYRQYTWAQLDSIFGCQVSEGEFDFPNAHSFLQSLHQVCFGHFDPYPVSLLHLYPNLLAFQATQIIEQARRLMSLQSYRAYIERGYSIPQIVNYREIQEAVAKNGEPPMYAFLRVRPFASITDAEILSYITTKMKVDVNEESMRVGEYVGFKWYYLVHRACIALAEKTEESKNEHSSMCMRFLQPVLLQKSDPLQMEDKTASSVYSLAAYQGLYRYSNLEETFFREIEKPVTISGKKVPGTEVNLFSIEEFLALIKSRGISDNELARILGVSRVTVYNWRYSVSSPSPKLVQKINDVFGTSYSIPVWERGRKALTQEVFKERAKYSSVLKAFLHQSGIPQRTCASDCGITYLRLQRLLTGGPIDLPFLQKVGETYENMELMNRLISGGGQNGA